MGKSIRARLHKIKQDIKRMVAEEVIVIEEHGDPFLEEYRLSVCETCEYKEVDEETGDEICGVCKCFLDVKAKSKTNLTKQGGVEITHCPKGKWDDEDIAEIGGSIEQIT